MLAPARSSRRSARSPANGGSGYRRSAPGADQPTLRRLGATAAYWIGAAVGSASTNGWLDNPAACGWILVAVSAVAALPLWTVAGDPLAWPRRVLIWAALALVAAISGSWLARPPDLLRLGDEHGGLAGPWRVRGVVEREPESTDQGSRFRLAVGQVWLRRAWRPLRGSVSISVAERRDPHLLAGTSVEAFLRLRSPRPPLNPYEPPRPVSRKIAAFAGLKSYRQLRPLAASAGVPPRLSQLRERIRQSARSRLGDQSAMGMALLLGERGAVADATTLALNRTGLAHLLAISGLHLGLLVGAGMAGLRASGGSPQAALQAGVAVAIAVPWIVAQRASILRASAMVLLALTARCRGRRVAPVDTLALAAFVVLVIEPTAALDRGLWLSVAAVTGILLVPMRSSRGAVGAVASLLGASIAAQAAVAPIVAGFSWQVATAGALLNVVGVPLLTVVLPTLVLTVALDTVGLAFPARLAGTLAATLLDWLGRLAAWGTAQPWIAVAVPSPSIANAMLWWGGLSALLLWPHRLATPLRRSAARLAGATAALLGGALALAPAGDPQHTQLIALDVGQGDSILVRTTAGSVLVDGGGYPGIDYDVGGHVIAPALRRLGVGPLLVLAGTHPHSDHYGGLLAVLQQHPASELWLAPAPGHDRLQTRLMQARGRVPALTPWAPRRFGPCLWSPLPAPPAALVRATEAIDNEASLALAVSCGRRHVLLTGDAGLPAEQGWELSGLRGGVLKVGHHGSASATGLGLVQTMRPRHAIVSVGARNSFGLPRDEVMDRLRAAGTALYRTDRDGAVTVTLGERVRVRGTRWRAGG